MSAERLLASKINSAPAGNAPSSAATPSGGDHTSSLMPALTASFCATVFSLMPPCFHVAANHAIRREPPTRVLAAVVRGVQNSSNHNPKVHVTEGPMAKVDTVFSGSIPTLYDRY